MLPAYMEHTRTRSPVKLVFNLNCLYHGSELDALPLPDLDFILIKVTLRVLIACFRSITFIVG